MINTLKRFHEFLLPKEKNLGYLPYVWLSYLLLFILPYVFYTPSDRQVIIAICSVVIFLVCYFSAYRADSRRIIFYIVAIWSLAVIVGVENYQANIYCVYAAAFLCRLGTQKKSLTGLVILLLVISVQAWWLSLSAFYYLPALFFSMMVGGINIYDMEIEKKQRELKLSQDEVRYLAKTAERERIARDLHDWVGHTFSMITLKAELAGKLIDKDIEKSKTEINDIENISREALSQVRSVVVGFRQLDLNSELAKFRLVMETAGITFNYQVIGNIESGKVVNAFASILKEASSNIVRHSSATACQVKIIVNQKAMVMTIQDNGPISDIKSGNGFLGMIERVKALSGTFDYTIDNGLLLTVSVPKKQQA